MALEVDVLVIGGGPGGYVAAIKAVQLGFKVACVEKSKTLGGTCLNVGCIPSKALLCSSEKYVETQLHLQDHGINVSDVSFDLKKMMDRKSAVVKDLTGGIDFLFKKNNILRLEGLGTIKSPTLVSVANGQKTEEVGTKYIIIATGSEILSLPHIPIDEKQIVSSTGALALQSAPKKMVVMGGGYIGLEMGSVWSRLGAEVTVVEFADSITPAMDKDLSKELQKQLTKQGITFNLQTKVVKVEPGKELTVHLENSDGVASKVKTDVLLVAIGRRPNTDNLGLENVGIKTDERGFIPVDKNLKTSVDNIFAIGDVIGGLMLAHKAEEEGVFVAELLAGQKPHINYNAIPGVIYTSPEVATVGLSEQAVKEQGISYKVGKFPFSANSRAKATGDTAGFVKIITHQTTDDILGVHIIAKDAGALIAEAVLAMEYKASAEDIARTCHAHPTTAEAIKEAALAAWTKPIHL